MLIQKYKSGTNQIDRLLPALQPEYVSVEERSIIDLLKYSRGYAKKVRFYSENNQLDGFWSLFLDFTDAEILELAEFADNPDIFKEDENRLAKYSKPHLAMLLAFLKLLKYPKNQFAELTGKNLEYFYRNVLKFSELDEVPDQVHIIFKLSSDVNEHLLKKGIFLNAGKDATGIDLHYEVQDDVVLNKSEISEIKTIHFDKTKTDLKYVHINSDRGDIGFERILCVVLDKEQLPLYRTAYGLEIQVDAKYLRTELYKRIKGKERDDLDKSDADYIFGELCFKYLKDFWYCLELLYREMNRGYVGVTLPEENEWEKVYAILEQVHIERLSRLRRLELKEIHKNSGFEAMMEFAFGEPNPWNMLFKMPDSVSALAALTGMDLLNAFYIMNNDTAKRFIERKLYMTFEKFKDIVDKKGKPLDDLLLIFHEIDLLEALYVTNNEAARKYIEKKLCMIVDDFKTVMEKKDYCINNIYSDEVYTLLETAWTKKRKYIYPSIGSDFIQGFYADTIFSLNRDKAIDRFETFGKSTKADSSENITMGFALSSPLLKLYEGNRTIEIIISCKQGTIQYDKISNLLAKNNDIFNTYLSTAKGWQQTDAVDFNIGKFILRPEIKTYNRKISYLVCNVLTYSVIDSTSVNNYIVFNNSNVYKIERYEEGSEKIYLKSVYLHFFSDKTKLISKLIPKTFAGEMKVELEIDIYAHKVKSSEETFNEYDQGKYFVDKKGNIFFIKKFIAADEAEIRYSGSISEIDSLIINRVWETIEPEYAEFENNRDITGLIVSGIYSGIHFITLPSSKRDFFEFDITDRYVKIKYPEGAKAGDLYAAWETWKDNPLNDQGRFEIRRIGEPSWDLSPILNQMEKTGEIIKRYESIEDKGIQVTYRGRLADKTNLIIHEHSDEKELAEFLISGDTLSITPGKVSKTAKQITAEWQVWKEQNDTKGFSIESRDNTIWNAESVEETSLLPVDKQIKKSDICDLYGNGIRVLYTGPIAGKPKVIIKENSIDLFDFSIDDAFILTITYPCFSVTSAHDLVESWIDWKNSEVNDPGNFDIKQLGDDFWTVRARTERELQAIENQVMECTVEEVGVILMYKFSEEFENAVVDFVEDFGKFIFEFSEIVNPANNKKTKKLIIKYPPLSGSTDILKKKHVMDFLKSWNNLYNKQGFAIIAENENPLWNLNSSLTINFLEDLNYVYTIHPDGFRVKYKPESLDDYKGKVIIEEKAQKDNEDTFKFIIGSDYFNNLLILYIYYPVERKNRTIVKLLDAWNAFLQEDPTDPERKKFTLVKSGTGKWEITGITEQYLSSEFTPITESKDPVNRVFYEYKTADINGFSVKCTSPIGTIPQIAIKENDKDIFEIDVISLWDEYLDYYIESFMTIKYPKRIDKRDIVDLLKVWHNWKKDKGDRFWGYEIVDTSMILDKRSEAPLLITGDVIREYRVGDGMYVTYTGHRDDVVLDIEEIFDFIDEDIGKKILWDTGEIFEVTDKLDKNNIAIERAGTIEFYDAIKQYEKDAFCMDGLKFRVNLDAEFPAVVSLQSENFTDWPVIKILLDNTRTYDDRSGEAVFYEYFNSICMERIDLKVNVKGITDIKMRGDVAKINPQNPFYPFGLTPDVDARFYFANSEICEKKIDSLNINLLWPESEINKNNIPDMEKYYYAYSHAGLSRAGTIKNIDFEVKLSFLDDRTWIPISEEPRILFNDLLSYKNFNNQTYQGELFIDEEIPSNPLTWSRYYKMELCNQGFMRDVYDDANNEFVRASSSMLSVLGDYNTIKEEIKKRDAEVIAAKIAEAEARANEISYIQPIIPEARELPSIPENDKDISSLLFNLPYSPILQSMSIDYTASSIMKLNEVSNSVNRGVPVSLFRFEPFGFAEMGKQDDEDDYLLPQYNNQGYLLIGIKNLLPYQNVSLLIQMISGSGDVKLTMPKISWDYLASNKWIPFKESDILTDMTFGLQNTGIIRFRMPEDATSSNTIVSSDTYWICARALNNITAVPDILDIRTQAVSATYVNQGNDPNHLGLPLSAYSIQELAIRDASIQEIIQPYSSFKGKMQEESKDFYIRVSERLKHKNRPLTLKDYENMILAQFSEIYKVKCMPQSELKILDNINEGEIVIIVILKNLNTTPFFPLKPKTPANILNDIEEYIKEYMPPLVSVKVINPRFEEIRYRFAVKFIKGCDQGFYINKLNEDIKRFLSPWAYEKEAEISFGTSVYSSSVINYIEKREYVDYVANFSLLQQIIEHETYTEVIPLFLTEDNAATVKYPDSILVSAENHIIDVIHTDLYDASAFRGIGYMTIGTDFWISRPGPVFVMGIGEMEIERWAVPRYIIFTVHVTVNVTGKINDVEIVKNISTTFSREDSQKIWNLLKGYGYIDAKGNVLTDININAEDFVFYVLKEPTLVAFVQYIKENISTFRFVINKKDFDENAGDDDVFSYVVNTISDDEASKVEEDVLRILREGMSFADVSQYPFIVN